jgi:CheY-like chemotaxis protein
MKSALLLEYDPDTRSELTRLLGTLGYIAVPAPGPQAALNTVQTLRFDLILTCTAFNADDRRSFVGELARLAPHAVIVFLVDEESARAGYHDRNAALLFTPVSLRALRRVIHFGLDGLGMQPAWAPPPVERRRQSPRRVLPR